MAETDWNNAHISANLSGILSKKKQEFSSEYYEEGIEKKPYEIVGIRIP